MRVIDTSVVLIYENRAFGQMIGTLLDQTPGFHVRLLSVAGPQLKSSLEEEKADVIVFLAKDAGLAVVSQAQKLSNEFGVPVILAMPTDGKCHYGDKEAISCVTYFADKTAPEDIAREIITKLRITLASYRSQAVKKRMIAERSNIQTVHLEEEPMEAVSGSHGFDPKKLIAIGASAGGTEAIYQVMAKLPGDLPGIVIVQHMPEGFTDMYAKRLDMNCAMKVVQASNGQRVERGWAYVAPGGKQLQVKRNSDGYYIHLYEGERVSGHIPSVDVMFDSVSKCAGKNALGIILTGMGSDGAKGLRALRDTGAHTIGQNQETCLVYGMPRVAFELGGVEEQAALGDIPQKIIRYAEG